MFGSFLGIGEQAGAVLGILGGRFAARPGAGDRPDRHLAVARPTRISIDEADQREAWKVEEIEEGRGIDPPQRPGRGRSRQGERRGEALRQDDWKTSRRRYYSFPSAPCRDSARARPSIAARARQNAAPSARSAGIGAARRAAAASIHRPPPQPRCRVAAPSAQTGATR